MTEKFFNRIFVTYRLPNDACDRAKHHLADCNGGPAVVQGMAYGSEFWPKSRVTKVPRE